MLHQIKSRLGCEPTPKVPTNRLIGEFGLLVTNFDRLTSQSGSRGISKQLSLTAAL